MQSTATISLILSVQTGQGKNGKGRKQDIVLDTKGQYTKKGLDGFIG